MTQDRSTRRGPSGRLSRAALPVNLLLGAALLAAARISAFASPAPAAGPAPIDTAFHHAQHTSVPCTSCHATDTSHGRIEVTTRRDCRTCHHQAPLAANCAACHDDGGPAGAYRETRTMTLSVRPSPVQREFTFQHAPHKDVACATCHTSGLALSADSVACNQCHQEHHRADASCMSCHRQPPTSAHPVAEAHLGCGGSGCHDPVPFQGVPRTRSLCLVCHQDKVDHKPGGNCADCHQLPHAGGRL